MSYRKLEIWQMARDLSIDIHKMTLEKLPKFEMFEEGTQIRRSSKSVRSNIVEGYGRRIYKMDYIKHLLYAQASNDETIDHLEILFETKSLTDDKLFKDLSERLNTVGKKLNKFIQAIQQPETRVK
ncbi:MAG: four helix bundle protein [Ignavibacteria bacterium]|nr:four helix bundle protein [Ignavibacteria bacterium]PIX94927.1 MAG: four helix bundle protein [Ignavibacteria bacterium CG_4_10_14_3_um_filter_37_18]PJC59523.1 MAG: four helix bundle protein [Ignavibacteria bacterium CG_4_9_14_0_2_um_filter_37_13]